MKYKQSDHWVGVPAPPGNPWTVGVVCVAGEADGVRGAADRDQGHSLFLEVYLEKGSFHQVGATV